MLNHKYKALNTKNFSSKLERVISSVVERMSTSTFYYRTSKVSKKNFNKFCIIFLNRWNLHRTLLKIFTAHPRSSHGAPERHSTLFEKQFSYKKHFQKKITYTKQKTDHLDRNATVQISFFSLLKRNSYTSIIFQCTDLP